jgi:hypothetical protein
MALQPMQPKALIAIPTTMREATDSPHGAATASAKGAGERASWSAGNRSITEVLDIR